MNILTTSEARENLYRLLDQTHETDQSITLSGQRNSVELFIYYLFQVCAKLTDIIKL